MENTTNKAEYMIRARDIFKSFQDNEVLVHRIGKVVMLLPKEDPWNSMMEGLSMFTPDFLQEDIEDLPLQERSFL